MKCWLQAMAGVSALVCFGAPSPAQQLEGAGKHLLIIHATNPIPIAQDTQSMVNSLVQTQGRFQVTFRITAVGTDDLPIATIIMPGGGMGRHSVFGWNAWNPGNGARCIVMTWGLAGLETVDPGFQFHVEDVQGRVRDEIALLEQRGAPNSVSSSRPSFVSADFDCTGPINIGDQVSIQARFYVRGPSGWVPADYTLEYQTVQGR